MKRKNLFYYMVLFAVGLLVVLLIFNFLSKQPTENVSETLLISSYTDKLLIFDPNSDKVIGEIPLGQPYIIKKILRYDNLIYIITPHQIMITGPNGSIKKIISANDTLADGIIKEGKLFTLGFIQLPGVPCNPSNISKASKSYLTVFDLNLLQLSKLEFDQHRFEGLTILNNSFFVSSFHVSKIYKIYGDKIISEIQLPQNSFPSQILSFGNKIIVLGRKQVFILPSDLSKFDILINESICDYYSKAFIYNNKLYATCFTGNKTIVYDLVQNKLIKQINTTLPFYVWGFKDKIYVTSAFAKKLYITDPNTNELIATIDFNEPVRVVG